MAGIERILIIHPDAGTRSAIEQALRRVFTGPAAVYQASSPTQGLQVARGVDPSVVLLDLTADRALALQVARELRRPGRRVLGLYNPLLDREAEADFYRAATRSGCSDFVPLPAADAELRDALASDAAGEGSWTAAVEGRLVTFLSHKGGVGKTTLAVNVAAVLTETAPRGSVALLDAVLRFGNTAAFLGLAPDHDLVDLVRDLDRLTAVSAYFTVHPPSGLLLLASPREPADAERISPEHLSRVLLELRRRFATVIVDAPAHLDALTLSILDLSDLIVVVTDAITPSVLGARRFLDLCAAQGLTPDRQRVVLNRYQGNEGNLDLDTVERQLGTKVSHVVPEERLAIVAANSGVPLTLGKAGQKTEFSRVVRRLAEDCATARPERAARGMA